jgi:type VI protein secretion system component VasF
MTISDNQQKNYGSEYYDLSGKNPVKDVKKDLTQNKIPWKVIIFLVGVMLVGMWFWWNIVQIKASSR